MAKASVKSAIRVLEVFEQFGEAQGPLRLKDVAARLGYPVSSTAALLKSISDRGYLTFDRISRQYFPTNKIPEIGLRLSAAAIEGRALDDAMEALRDATSEFVAVGTPNDIYIDYIKSLRSTQPIQLYSPAGTRRLMVQSGMGLLLLSRMPEAAALRLYRRTVSAREISQREFSEAQFLTRLRKLRDRGHVFTRSSDYVRTSAHSGGAIVAMIVPTPPSHRSLVLAIGGPAERLEKNLAHIVRSMETEVGRLSDLAIARGAHPGNGRVRSSNVSGNGKAAPPRVKRVAANRPAAKKRRIKPLIEARSSPRKRGPSSLA
jgi:DNA-binding IclR family transcriptional regulator